MKILILILLLWYVFVSNKSPDNLVFFTEHVLFKTKPYIFSFIRNLCMYIYSCEIYPDYKFTRVSVCKVHCPSNIAKKLSMSSPVSFMLQLVELQKKETSWQTPPSNPGFNVTGQFIVQTRLGVFCKDFCTWTQRRN